MDQLLTFKDVSSRTRLGRTSIYRLMRQGRFPRPKKIGPQAVRWRESELQEWIDGCPLATAEAEAAAEKPEAEPAV